jgi:hypothetical protein
MAGAPKKRAVKKKKKAGAKKKTSKTTVKKPKAIAKIAKATKATKKAATKKAATKKAATKKAATKKAATKKKRRVASERESFPTAPISEVKLPTDPEPPPRKGSGTEPPPPAKEPTTERSPEASVVPSTPSERVLAARAEQPTERSLTDEEREAMMKVSETARRFVGANGAPTEIIGSIASFLEDVRLGRRDEPKSQDVRLGLGVLWGEQLRAQVGWRWVHLTYPDGFASYALVPDDRAFACFPLNRVPEVLGGGGANTSAHIFESIRENALPTRHPNTYLVIG